MDGQAVQNIVYWMVLCGQLVVTNVSELVRQPQSGRNFLIQKYLLIPQFGFILVPITGQT